MDLLATEIRVLGSLLEKQRTTPDAYPLTLNSLRLACNQSTNRDPVVQFSEAEVRDAVQRLERRGMARFASGAGSRAAKFRHLLSERLPMDDGEQAVICVLMLRGAQTPGELKQRAERMHPFADLAEVEQTLARLIDRELVSSVLRRPGQKEERYMQLLGGEEEQAERGASGVSEPAKERPAGMGPASPIARAPAPAPPAGAERELAELRERVQRLEREMESLKAELGVGADS
ncbi:MAG: YceH family protein [Solirubrobacteraceae bacterium]